MQHELVKSIKDLVQDEMSEIHTAMPGRIEYVDEAKCLANVTPLLKKKFRNGNTIGYPLITGVPILFPMSGKTEFVFPVKPGDTCLLIISEQSLDMWMFEMETHADLPFDLSNAVCIPGFFNKAPKSLGTALEEDAVIVKAESTVLKVSPEGITVDGNLNVTGNIVYGGSIEQEGGGNA